MPLLLHLDDSLTAIRLFAAQVKALRPDLLMKACRTVREAEAFLSGPDAEVPWLLVTDVNLPGEPGFELVSWVRRNLRIHRTPIAVMSAASEAEYSTRAGMHGILKWVTKPATLEQVGELLAERDRLTESQAVRASLEAEFGGTAVQSVETLRRALEDAGRIEAVFQTLHSLKGEAAALLFADMAEVAHALETLVVRGQDMGYPELAVPGFPLGLFRVGLDFLLDQARLLGAAAEGRYGMLERAPERLIGDLEAMSRNLPPAQALETSPSRAEAELESTSSALGLEDDPDIGLEVTAFERMQEKVRGVLRQGARISQGVKHVASGNPELGELLELVQRQDMDFLEMVSTMVSCFTVRGDRLSAYLQTLAGAVSRVLGKRVRLDLDIHEGLEIDQPVYLSLKTIFVHLMRNALDHGIESAEERVAAGKPEDGRIIVQVRPDRRFRYRILFQDDGRGIDAARLRDEAVKLGVLSPERARAMSDTEALSLIFEDSLTTKDDASVTSGRGVGMSVVKRMIERRSGSISVSSRTGAGTGFEIVLTKVLKLTG